MLLHLTENSPEPLGGQIARQLRSKILAGELPAGWEIPECRKLARQLRVSPACVARALAALVAEGVLEGSAEEAVRVAAVPPDRRRTLAQRHLLDDAREQELSLRELELACEIQRRLLPPARVAAEGYTVVSRSFPARFVAGDFHDVIRHADGSLDVVVADVAGKGFGASLIMASVKAMTPFVTEGRAVADALRELNRRLAGELGRRQFVALACARITPDGAVELANAGMPDPLVLRAGAGPTAVEVPGPRLPLGIRAEVAYASITFPLEEGARLLLFSDGIAEARRPSGEPLGYDGLSAILSRSAGQSRRAMPPEEWLDGILDEAQRITDFVLDDDWTAVAVERSRDEA
ncbi:MAG: SpoIIE family protein phosphatase [Acidobacteriota bacterium]